jgi:carboxypeptidase Q
MTPIARALLAAVLLSGCAVDSPVPIPGVVPTPAPPLAPSPGAPLVPPPPEPGPAPPPPPLSAPLRPVSPLQMTYGPTVERILTAARTGGRAHEKLRHLCDAIGNRLSGSEGLEKAVAWAAETMRKDGLENVRTEPVMVPKWVRGEGEVVLLAPRRQRLQALAIGNSVASSAADFHDQNGDGDHPRGTATGATTAEVVVARDWKELEALGEKVKGKIVLFHHPMPRYEPGKDTGYGESVDYRVNGASRAAKMGAVGVLVCSATARSLGTPHTGMLRYADDAPKIPAACLSPEDSAMLLRIVEAGETVKVEMKHACRFEEDVPSANVVGEIRGSEKPGEIVVFGGHLDSWDVGQGAHDDGGPCMAIVEALRLLRSLGLRPRRTIRAVLFTNEENGLRGGRQYAKDHAAERHVAALEADSGAFRPVGFTTPFPKPEMEPEKQARLGRQVARLRDVAALLEGAGAGEVRDGGGGADIGPLEEQGVPQIGFEVDMATYFDIHHTAADTFDKVKKEEIDLCAGVLAALVYVLADMPESLRE